MENKNTVIAMVLMLVVWVGFSILYPSQRPLAPTADSPAVAQNTTAETSPPAMPSAPTPEQGGVDLLGSDIVVGGSEKEVVVEHPFFRAVFTNIGARLKSLELKQYTATSDPGDGGVSLVHADSARFATLASSGGGDFDLSADTYFSVDGGKDGLRLDAGEEGELVFLTRLPSGLIVAKSFFFNGDQYEIRAEIKVHNQGAGKQRGAIDFSLVEPEIDPDSAGAYDFVGASTMTGGKVEKVSAEDIGEEVNVYKQDPVWTGFGNKYFLSAIVPLQGAVKSIRLEKDGPITRNIVEAPEQILAPGEAAYYQYVLYFGPRDLDILKQVGHQLSEAVDFGFFSPIAKPLLHVLKFFYGFLGNYGLSIILLTVIIKLLFWPLTQKSYSSMKAMQKLQPQMQKIREKFGKDRERLNKEIMELYKTHRVNPLGGCLPMLVQIPVFFALYKTLMEAIELRHAPFYLWITDLSAKDPYYVTPLIMGATMFLQQKMTPSTLDPMQAKLFLMMPIIFTFMFLNFPSGLVLYWLVNNLLTIGQQYYINKKA